MQRCGCGWMTAHRHGMGEPRGCASLGAREMSRHHSDGHWENAMGQFSGREGLGYMGYVGCQGVVGGCTPTGGSPPGQPSPSVAPQTSFLSISRNRGLSGKQCSSRSWREAGMATTARNRGQYLSWGERRCVMGRGGGRSSARPGRGRGGHSMGG